MLHVSPTSAAFEATPADPRGSARALVERQVAMLDEMAGMGMEIARSATRRATAGLDGEAKAGDRGDPTLAYARAARAVRMCIALQARLVGELPQLERDERAALSELRGSRKRRIVGLVKTLAATEHADEMGEIHNEAWERLRDADEYGAVMTGSLREAVAQICNDLGVTPDWSLWGEVETPDPQAPHRVRLRDGGLIGEEPIMGPQSREEGIGALAPAAASQSPHPRVPPYFPRSRAASGEEPDISEEEPDTPNRIARPAPPG